MHQDANVVETVGDAANDYARRLAIGLNVVTLIERLQCELRGEIALRKRSSRHAEIHVQEPPPAGQEMAKPRNSGLRQAIWRLGNDFDSGSITPIRRQQ